MGKQAELPLFEEWWDSEQQWELARSLEGQDDCDECCKAYARAVWQTLGAKLAEAQRAFDDLRKADREALTEALAAAIEQQQRYERAAALRDEWCDAYVKVRDELASLKGG